MEGKNIGGFFRKYPLIPGVISFFVLYGGIKLIHTSSNLQDTILRIVLSAIMILVMWPAVGNRWLTFPGGGWKEAFKSCKWLLILTAVLDIVILALGVIVPIVSGQAGSLAESFSDGASDLSGSSFSPLKLIMIPLYFAAVGIAEELGVRRAIFDMGMQQFPNMKNKVMWWAVISSFVFGFMHVSANLSAEPTAIASAIAKTLCSGMFGFIMCAVVIETQNIWTVAAIHAINDLIPGWLLILAPDTGLKTNYVTIAASWSEWFASSYSELLLILMYLPFVIKAYKKLKEYD